MFGACNNCAFLKLHNYFILAVFFTLFANKTFLFRLIKQCGLFFWQHITIFLIILYCSIWKDINSRNKVYIVIRKYMYFDGSLSRYIDSCDYDPLFVPSNFYITV